VCKHIAIAIGKLGDEKVVPSLVKVLGNQSIDRSVRSCIAIAIGKLGNGTAISDLTKMRDEEIDFSVRRDIDRAIELITL
jgi:HEAT repeat protein